MSTAYDHLSATDAHLWTRRGTEAETDDWTSGQACARTTIATDDLRSALAGHHEGDLAALASDEARVEALGAMVAAYEAQRAGRAAAGPQARA